MTTTPAVGECGMNPNAALANIRALALDMQRSPFDRDELLFLSNDLAHEIETLDQWITTGGALPADWDHHTQ